MCVCVSTQLPHVKCCIGLELLLLLTLLQMKKKIQKSITYHDTNNSETIKVALLKFFQTLCDKYNKLLPNSKSAPLWAKLMTQTTRSYMIVIIKMKAISPGEKPRIPNMFDPVRQGAQRHALIQPSFLSNCEINRNWCFIWIFGTLESRRLATLGALKDCLLYHLKYKRHLNVHCFFLQLLNPKSVIWALLLLCDSIHYLSN